MSTPLARAFDPSGAVRRRRRGVWLIAGAWCTVAAVLIAGQIEPAQAVVIDDLTQGSFALVAAGCCAAAALRSTGRLRRAWSALSLATLGWGLGQVVWSVEELALGHPHPFPSLADLGYLVFPVGTTLAVTLFPTEHTRLRGRDVLDGLILALTLSAVSWTTGLGAVVREGHHSTLGEILSIIYPVSDVIVLTMTLLAAARATALRGILILVAGGVAAMAGSDGAFTYLTAVGAYTSGNADSLGWIAAFALLAIAGLRQPDRVRHRRHRATGLPTPGPADSPQTRLATNLIFVPYLPLSAAGTAVVVQWVYGTAVDAGEVALLLSAAALTVARQLVTLHDHRRLIADVTAREADLTRQAERDPLTGLASRAYFIGHVSRALRDHRDERRPLSVIFCDVNDFKGINDGLGHAVGDLLLTMVALRLHHALDGEGVLARLGGDEFAVLLCEPDGRPHPAAWAASTASTASTAAASSSSGGSRGEATAGHVAARLQAALAEELMIAGATVRVGISIGVAHVAEDDETPSTDGLLSRADIAMYTAKRGPSTSPVHYRRGLSLPEAGDWILRPPLEQALRDGDVVPYYQPIVELEPGRLHGFEALARWRRGHDLISPAVFLPVAQRAGLMPALTAHMLQVAGAQLVEWTSRPGLGHLRVAVNVSPSQLVDPQFPDMVAAVLDQLDIPLGSMVIEITEEVLLTDLDAAVRAAQTLRGLGVLICLDDFGVGYSSFAQLHRLPLDKLKLDRSFVATVETDPGLRRLLGGLFALTRDLGLCVVAEGIERPGQARVLRDLGCPQGQGLLYSGAVAPFDCEPLLSRVGSAYRLPARVPLQVTG